MDVTQEGEGFIISGKLARTIRAAAKTAKITPEEALERAISSYGFDVIGVALACEYVVEKNEAMKG